MLTGDIGAQLAAVLHAGVTNGALPPAAAVMTAAGTWRPAPAGAGGGPGTYASSLPFALARMSGHAPASVAAYLAAQLGCGAGIAAASVTGGGYLTVTVTGAALAALAPRIVLAGRGCAGSSALAGTKLADIAGPDLAAAATWPQAWQWQAQAVTVRMAAAAGAQLDSPAERACPAPSPLPPGPSPVQAAIAYAGPDAVRYALARAATGGAARLRRENCVRHDLSNPLYAVCLAHADAAGTPRRAADLRLARLAPAGLAPGLLAAPGELRLLDALSWLPERVAGAARRGRPHELAAYLEHVAAGWFDCREQCPALPFGGRGAAREAPLISARLWLADAVRTVLAVGLELIGVTPPQRM
ncbi:MAG: DALR anticodon-binding domain-containing protein [Streptosporangiaceae bacterium]